MRKYVAKVAKKIAPRDPDLRARVIPSLEVCYLKGYELHRRIMQRRAVP